MEENWREDNDITKVCSLCDNLDETKLSKCLDCDLNMCQLCTKGHTRVKVTSHHRIVTDYPWGPQTTTSRSITCATHTGETPSFYCYTCNQLICCECITSAHSQHKCSVIKIAVQEISQMLTKNLEIFKETKMSTLEHKIKKVEQLKQDNKENGMLSIQNIKARWDTVVGDITDTGQKMIQESKALHQENDKYLTNIWEHLEQEYSDMTSVSNKYHEAMQSNKNAEKMAVLIQVSTELKKFKSNHDKIREIHLPKFVPKNIVTAEAKLLLGSIETDDKLGTMEMVEELGSDFDSEIIQVNKVQHSNAEKSDSAERNPSIQSSNYNPEILNLSKMLKILNDEAESKEKSAPRMNYDVKILESFKIKEKTITSICPFENSNILIHYMDNYKNYIININGRVQSKFKVHFLIRDMLPTKNGIIATDVENKIIHKITKTGEQIQEINVALTLPYRLCMCKDGNLLVTMIDKWSFEVKHDSRRYVAKMTPSGQELKVYEYDNNGERLFTLPISVGETRNNDICVIDKTKPDKGRLILFDKTGIIKATYHGEPTRMKFIPRRVKCDDIGHIILTDKINNSVHLLNQRGQFIQYLLTNPQINSDPWSLAIDPYGYLWLGCGDGQIYVLTYTQKI